ncbi:hypothetical protein PIB30_089847 [Stylosanthes scabra]|uniref:Uncharacterized protein n=1 Tax=Stylosanthes scabra TaxID=79078 RepID=A0ABU6WSI1_9FABA|nr:hypothetical protein [Stylosanthes scabra]
MAEERASNSPTSTDESTTTDKTQPSPGTSVVAATASTVRGWYSPLPQGGNYGYSNNPLPPFDPFETGVGGYNPPIFCTFSRPSMSNPPYCGPIHSTIPVVQQMPNPQLSQAAILIPQAASTEINRSIFTPKVSKLKPFVHSSRKNLTLPYDDDFGHGSESGGQDVFLLIFRCI